MVNNNKLVYIQPGTTKQKDFQEEVVRDKRKIGFLHNLFKKKEANSNRSSFSAPIDKIPHHSYPKNAAQNEKHLSSSCQAVLSAPANGYALPCPSALENSGDKLIHLDSKKRPISSVFNRENKNVSEVTLNGASFPETSNSKSLNLLSVNNNNKVTNCGEPNLTIKNHLAQLDKATDKMENDSLHVIREIYRENTEFNKETVNNSHGTEHDVFNKMNDNYSYKEIALKTALPDTQMSANTSIEPKIDNVSQQGVKKETGEPENYKHCNKEFADSGGGRLVCKDNKDKRNSQSFQHLKDIYGEDILEKKKRNTPPTSNSKVKAPVSLLNLHNLYKNGEENVLNSSPIESSMISKASFADSKSNDSTTETLSESHQVMEKSVNTNSEVKLGNSANFYDELRQSYDRKLSGAPPLFSEKLPAAANPTLDSDDLNSSLQQSFPRIENENIDSCTTSSKSTENKKKLVYIPPGSNIRKIKNSLNVTDDRNINVLDNHNYGHNTAVDFAQHNLQQHQNYSSSLFSGNSETASEISGKSNVSYDYPQHQQQYIPSQQHILKSKHHQQGPQSFYVKDPYANNFRTSLTNTPHQNSIDGISLNYPLHLFPENGSVNNINHQTSRGAPNFILNNAILPKDLSSINIQSNQRTSKQNERYSMINFANADVGSYNNVNSQRRPASFITPLSAEVGPGPSNQLQNTQNINRIRPMSGSSPYRHSFVPLNYAAISVTQLNQKLSAHVDGKLQNLHLLDVRETQEWNDCYIPSATYTGRGCLERDIEGLIPDPYDEIIVYCASGNRSLLAAESLRNLGYKNVFNLEGGIKSWKNSGLEIVKNKVAYQKRILEYS
ncbi:hypothetical protein HDU92_000386 [Lobulomyces angularis]|nr:hypothetical protein HDU92_000386 [Lobulomyces angularis]